MATKAWTAAWQLVRVARWGLWLSVLAYGVYFLNDRSQHFTPLGALKHSTELALFGLPGAAILAGFLELIFRARVNPAGVLPDR